MGNFAGKESEEDGDYGLTFIDGPDGINESEPLSFVDGSPTFGGDFQDEDDLRARLEREFLNGADDDDKRESIQKSAMDEIFDDNNIPMVFRWEGGGEQVYIAGTFNKWSEKIPMHQSGNDFTYIHNLRKGKHAYKFIVDDEWRFATDQLTVSDTHGNINNFVDLSNFEPTLRNDMSPVDAKDYITNDSGYGDYIPGMDDYTKEPPILPPHLRHIILNASSSDRGRGEMDIPQHVTLDHLYCTALKKDGLMVLGMTQRFRQKFVTTVYYSPEEPHIGVDAMRQDQAKHSHHHHSAHHKN